MPAPTWTPDRDDVLRELWPKGLVHEAMSALNITKDAARQRACMLGLVSPKTALVRENIQLVREGKRRCSGCNEVRPLADFYFHSRWGRPSGACKFCTVAKPHRSLEAKLRKTTAVSSGAMTLEALLLKWERQGGKCAYSGESMTWGYGDECCVTVDRIDSDLGYTDENTVLCCYRPNMMKHQQTVPDFVSWCQKIAAHCKT